MQILPSFLSAVVVASQLGLLCRGHLLSGQKILTSALDRLVHPSTTPQGGYNFYKNGKNGKVAQEGDTVEGSGKSLNGDQDEEDEDDYEDQDFEDDDEPTNLGVSTNSVTHWHRKNGEILVPCFGMWWPVGGRGGGGGGYYDYGGGGGGYYYDDYRRRKRRRSKKQRKAKMKRKKA